MSLKHDAGNDYVVSVLFSGLLVNSLINNGYRFTTNIESIPTV